MATFDNEVLSFGLPPFLPLALAADTPAIVRSRIKFRSNSGHWFSLMGTAKFRGFVGKLG